MQSYSPDQLENINSIFARMKFYFIVLMFMFVAIYIYADRHQFATSHNIWLGVILGIIMIGSLGYIFYLAKLVKFLGENAIKWVLPTIIFGPIGLLLSYILISNKVNRLQQPKS